MINLKVMSQHKTSENTNENVGPIVHDTGEPYVESEEIQYPYPSACVQTIRNKGEVIPECNA